jgi:hypothetical protein
MAKLRHQTQTTLIFGENGERTLISINFFCLFLRGGKIWQ